MKAIKYEGWAAPTRVFAILIFLATSFLVPAVSFAEYVGSFARIEGRVDLLRAGATAVVAVRQGDGVSMGDIIRTKSDGKAEILFKDDTTVTVASETRLKIDEYTFNADKSRNKGILSLFRGKVRAAVSKVKGGLIPVSIGSSTFNINTPTTVAGVRGTVLFVFYERGITGVVFKEGNGFVYNQNMPDRIVNVSAGQATFILKDDAPPLPPRPATDAEMTQYIKATTIDGGHADTGGPLDQTGGGDLSGYNAHRAASMGDNPVPPPPVLPITETDTGMLKETVSPLITIMSSPQAITNSSSGSFTITASEPVTFTYSMGSWGVTTTLTTSDTITLAGLPEGSHTLNITATDAAGNVTTSSYSWTTDYTAPTVSLSGTPASITSVNSANIAVTATDANTVTKTYKLDGATVTSPTLTGLTEGQHTFVVTATDTAGNVTTSSYTWTTDYTGPVATLTPAASPESGDLATIKVDLSSNESSTYLYKLDGGSLTSTGATLSLSGISEGSHTVDIQATDVVGNVSTKTLAFDLSRYSLSGSASASGITGSITIGEVAGISNKNWGGWKLGMSGTYTAMPPSFTLYAGGTSLDATSTNNGGYWIDIISGTSDGVSSLSGTSGLKYLSYDRVGSGTGSFIGSYGAGTWSATDTGTYTETPLAWSGQIPSGTTNNAGLYSFDQWYLYSDGPSTGLMGGVTSPWAGATAVTYMGTYTVGGGVGPPYIWAPEINSYNVNNATNTTFDNGAYKGFIGGVWKGDGTIDAKVYSLYIDPAGNAGILKGDVTGAYYPQLNMFKADGTWTPTAITTGLNAGTATYNIVSTDFWNRTGSGNFNGAGSITVNQMAMNGGTTFTDWRYSITGQDWGVSKSIIGGTYTGPTSDTWSLSTTVTLPTTIYGTKTDGTKWSSDVNGNNVLAGTTLGYGADITTTPITWISVGETLGTFDANNLTWQAVQTGAWLDTNRFLAMTQTAGGQAKLAELNIPFVEVGKASLTGTNSQWAINMNNTTFFAYSNGAAPKIWATGGVDVNGSYNCSACGPTPTLTGNGLSANLNMQTWDTVGNKWMATVSGSGTYSGTGTMNGSAVQFNGAAAGTNTGIGPGTFTGTGAGVAK